VTAVGQRGEQDATTLRRRTPLGAVLVAYLVSVMCTAVSAVAIPWLVLSTTGSATSTGLVVFAEMAPYVVMQAIAGPWVERFGPRRASWSANLLAGLALLTVPGLYLAGHLGFGPLVAVVAVVGLLRGVADCGSAPLVPGTAELAGTPLERAAGLHASATQAGQLLGAPAAAVLLTFSSAPLVVAVGSCGFLGAAALIGFLVPNDVGTPHRDLQRPEPYARRLAAGLMFLARNRVLRALVVMIALTNLVSAGFVSVLLPSWVLAEQLPVAAVGTVAAGFGVGALVGSLTGAWIAPRANRWLLYSIAFLVGGSPLYFGLAALHATVPATVLAACCGLAMGCINPVVGAVQYEQIPREILPRVLGAVKASAWVGLPLGPVLTGLVTDQAGVRTALVGMGAAMLLFTLAPFVVPAFRQMNRAPLPRVRPRAGRRGSRR
jgi:MFS family permease